MECVSTPRPATQREAVQPELHTGKGRTATGIVLDGLHHTLDVAMALRKVILAELGSADTRAHVGLEDPAKRREHKQQNKHQHPLTLRDPFADGVWCDPSQILINKMVEWDSETTHTVLKSG
jgi:hypothetical protein